MVIQAEDLHKRYRLGTVGSRTLRDDLEHWWQKITGKEKKDDSEKYHDALKGVSFTVKRGEVVGLIGKNGAGKSTLLKILSKVTSPTKGTVKIKGRLASLLEVGTGFHPELTGLENIYLNGAILGMTRQEIKKKQDEIIEFAGIEKYINTPVKRYSSGMYVRLAFAVAAHLDPDILVVDEVLAVGDIEFQKKCLGKMDEVSRKEGRTIIFVSHNMGAIKSLCNRGLVLDKGKLIFDGNLDNAISCYKNANRVLDLSNLDSEAMRMKPSSKIKFVSAEISSQDGEEKEYYYLFEPLKVKLKFHIYEDIRNACILIGILKSDGSVLASVSTQDFGKKKLALKAGEGQADVIIEQNLSPGEYSLAFGICPLDGNDCFDYLENLGIFRVLNRSIDENYYFPWHNYGNVSFKSHWNFSEHIMIA